jgi:hypothetical protein
MQLPMGFTHEQFADGQRAAEFLGLPRKSLLNLARRGSVQPKLPNTTVVDRVGAEANRAFDSGSTWLGIDVVFATGTNAADVQDRAIRATAIR